MIYVPRPSIFGSYHPRLEFCLPETRSHFWLVPPVSHGRYWTVAFERSTELWHPDPELRFRTYSCGSSVPFSSPALRIFSSGIYSLLIIPGINLLPPFLFFLALHITYTESRLRHPEFWRRIEHYSNHLGRAAEKFVQNSVFHTDAHEPGVLS